MVQLPTEVSEAIAMASVNDPERELKEPEDTLVQRVLRRIAAIFGQAVVDTGSERSDSSNEFADETNVTSESTCDSAYGYPPAYGVPSSVAVQLLNEALQVLKEVGTEVEGELAEKVNSLVQRISEALGATSAKNVTAQEFVDWHKVFDWIKELQLAVTVQQGTQPVLPPREAAEKLNDAWTRWYSAIITGTNVIAGEIFEAMFNLRAAIAIAQRSLLALSQSSEAQEGGTEGNESVTDGTANTVDEVTVNQTSSEVNEPDASDEQANTSMAAQAEMQSQAETQSQAEAQSQDEADSSGSKPEETDLASVVMQLAAQVSEMNQRLQSLETQMKERRRVTMFAASTEQRSSDEDLWKRWQSATTEAERRRILREAQKLLAEPVQLDK